MNTSRVPGITRNTGWLAIDAEIAAEMAPRRECQPVHRADGPGDPRGMDVPAREPKPVWRTGAHGLGACYNRRLASGGVSPLTW